MFLCNVRTDSSSSFPASQAGRRNMCRAWKHCVFMIPCMHRKYVYNPKLFKKLNKQFVHRPTDRPPARVSESWLQSSSEGACCTTYCCTLLYNTDSVVVVVLPAIRLRSLHLRRRRLRGRAKVEIKGNAIAAPFLGANKKCYAFRCCNVALKKSRKGVSARKFKPTACEIATPKCR